MATLRAAVTHKCDVYSPQLRLMYSYVNVVLDLARQLQLDCGWPCGHAPPPARTTAYSAPLWRTSVPAAAQALACSAPQRTRWPGWAQLPATASLAAALEQSLAFAAKNAPGSRDRATKERMPLRSTGRRADLEHVGPSTPPTASSGDYSGPLSTVKLSPGLSSNGARIICTLQANS